MNTSLQSAFRRLAAGATVLAALASSASAASLSYTLQDVRWSDGTTATGSFTWDTATSKLTFADIKTQDGTLSAFEYLLGNSAVGYGPFGAPADRSFLLNYQGVRYVSFIFDHSLSNGGVNPITITGLISPGSYECDNCLVARAIISGSVVAVPEPETYAMLLAGLGLVGVASRRRKIC